MNLSIHLSQMDRGAGGGGEDTKEKAKRPKNEVILSDFFHL